MPRALPIFSVFHDLILSDRGDDRLRSRECGDPVHLFHRPMDSLWEAFGLFHTLHGGLSEQPTPRG